MAKRPSNLLYNFSVEGETEEAYLKWLQKTINAQDGVTRKVKFNYKVCRPMKAVKSLNILGRATIWHLFDYESSTTNDQGTFYGVLDEMKNAQKCGKSIQYVSGYINLTFELWLILHKEDCNTPLNSKRAYLNKLNTAYHMNFEDLATFKEASNFQLVLAELKLDDVKDAIRRAVKIENSHITNGDQLKDYRGFKYYEENPATSLGDIFGKILCDCGLID